MRKVGLFVKKADSIFTNGCLQQVYFIYKLLKNTDFDPVLVTIEEDFKTYPYMDIPIIKLALDSDFRGYICVIFISGVVSNETFLKILDIYGVKKINMICGNLFFLHQEEFVFNVHDILTANTKQISMENWILPMYHYAKSYIEHVTNTPSRITPYAWSPDIIDVYNNKVIRDKYDIFDDVENRFDKINILIFEPNMSIHKTSLIPLLICNRFYKNNPDKIHKVYHFCSSKNIHTEFLKTLEIYNDNKIELLPRMIMSDSICIIRNNNQHFNVVLSHNIMNDLNFLHLEMFTLGIPIVHNCKPYIDSGYYYTSEDLDEAYHHLMSFFTSKSTFDRETYKSKCKSILDTYSPNNKESVEIYNNLLKELEKQHDEDQNKNVHFEQINWLSKTSANQYASEKRIDFEPDSKGEVTYINNEKALQRFLLSFSLRETSKEKCNLELFFNANVLTEKQIHTYMFGLDTSDIVLSSIQNAFPFCKQWDENILSNEELMRPAAMYSSKFQYVLYTSPFTIILQNPNVYFNVNLIKSRGAIFWVNPKPEQPYNKNIMNVHCCLSKHSTKNAYESTHVISTDIVVIDKSKYSNFLFVTALTMQKQFTYYNQQGISNDMIWSIVLSSTPHHSENIPAIISTQSAVITSKDGVVNAYGLVLIPNHLSHIILINHDNNVDKNSISHIMFPSSDSGLDPNSNQLPPSIQKKIVWEKNDLNI